MKTLIHSFALFACLSIVTCVPTILVDDFHTEHTLSNEEKITANAPETAWELQDRQLFTDHEKIGVLADIVANFVSKDGKTALHYAVSKGNEKMVKFLIEHGANPNAKDNAGQTPLFNIPPDSESLSNLLVKNGASMSDVDDSGNSILDHAIENGNDNLVDTLLKNGAFSVGTRTLSTAIIHDKKTIVEKLIHNGLRVNETDSEGRSTLHIAAASGSKNVIDTLLKHGIDINSTNNKRANALHEASANDKREITEILIAKGTNLNQKDNEGHTPLHLAISHGALEVVKVLIENKARLHVPDNNGDTPLKYAEVTGHLEDFLLVLNELGVDMGKFRTQDDICSMIEAISDGTDEQMNNIFIQRVGDQNVNQVCKELNGNTGLMRAAELGRSEIIELLIRNGANVNRANSSGVTPLFLSVINGTQDREDIARLLLDLGASKDDTDSSNRTAAVWAREKGFLELGDLIENWGTPTSEQFIEEKPYVDEVWNPL